MRKFIYLAFVFMVFGCNEVKKENRPLVNHVHKKVDEIDSNHRVRIEEGDFHLGDSIYKIRGYFMDDHLMKLVGILHTPHFDRDDYFYFEKNHPIFSGHLVVLRDTHIASEYKYYYGEDGYVQEALYWKDKYEIGKKFPHEHFMEFDPDKDSLKISEQERLVFFLDKLDRRGFEIKHLNENLEANTKK